MKKDRYFGISPRLTPWKKDNWFENWLSYRADNSEFWKFLYVSYYKLSDRKYYNGGLKLIDRWLEMYKSLWEGNFTKEQLIRDMVYCHHRYGISFQDYWIYEFINQSNFARCQFVPDKLRYHYCDILNDGKVLPLTTDKYACYKVFKKFYKRDVLGLYKEEDYNLFEEFCQKHDKFIYKPLSEHSGHGIQLVISANINLSDFFSDRIKHGSFVVEEVIVQGEGVARMHSACVNSFRVVTFTINGNVNIIGVTWRIGSGKAVMDNAGAGGMFAVVNPEKGFVETPARRYNTEEYYVHPDSGQTIVGYQLPDWDEALATIKEIATTLEGATMVSWDLCYSNKGWMMVEANDNGDWSIIQSNKKVGKKPLLYSYMDDYFKYKNKTNR